jgi:ABC-type amino acid transport substrate-binding protein
VTLIAIDSPLTRHAARRVLFALGAALFGALLLTGSTHAATPQPLHLVVPPFEYNNRPENRYFYRLLQLVLSKTEAADGSFVVDTYPSQMSPVRSVTELKNKGAINLIWNGTSAERERDLLPVKIALTRDLNSYRICLIRKDDQARFDQVRTVEDLRKLIAGSGTQWPDTDILRANGLQVVTTTHHASLFPMLAAKRFDYTARGLYEVFGEAEQHKDKGIVIEDKLIIYYALPMYFFVNKDNTALASRLERGLKKAQADGSFDQLLMSVPGFKRGMEEQRQATRRLIVLDSPFKP